jgi:hypothetical protein
MYVLNASDQPAAHYNLVDYLFFDYSYAYSPYVAPNCVINNGFADPSNCG